MTTAEYRHTIAGRSVSSDATFEVANPATGRTFAHAPECSPEQLEAAVAAATQAFPAWRRDAQSRREALLAAAATLEAGADDLASVITAEQGKPLADARMEVMATAGGLRHHAGLNIPRDLLRDDDEAFVEQVHRPLGVVAGIIPWNFPVAIAGLKMGPALLTGNTLVIKPSPFTPLATLLMGELLRNVFPPGVVNVISGSDPLGARLAEHPGIAKVTFTGSVETGKKVAAAGAKDLKRLTLELGGNDAAIVLDDFDVDGLADRLFWTAFANCGQICAAVKRVYVPQHRHDEVVDALADRARAVKVGDGMAEGTQMGPLQNRPQWMRVGDLLEDALASGGSSASGGGPLDGEGYFFAPTVVTGVEDGVRLVDEEQFGPVLPVIPYRTVEDAVARANATHYGLGGSVWGVDVDRATDVAAQLECGTGWVNTHAVPHPEVPFGGAKWSGLGVEGGREGLLSFTQGQVLYRARG